MSGSRSSDNRLFDDLTRVAGGAASVISALGKQLGEGFKDQLKDKIGESGFGPFGGTSSQGAQDDMDRLLGMVSKLRMEQDALIARVAELESALGIAPKKAAKTPSPKKPAAKKPVKAVKAAKAVAKKPSAAPKSKAAAKATAKTTKKK